MKPTNLRRLAWLVFGATVTMYLLSIVTSKWAATDTAPPDTWGAGGTLGNLLFLVGIVAFPVVGILIARRQPNNVIGWILSRSV